MCVAVAAGVGPSTQLNSFRAWVGAVDIYKNNGKELEPDQQSGLHFFFHHVRLWQKAFWVKEC